MKFQPGDTVAFLSMRYGGFTQEILSHGNCFTVKSLTPSGREVSLDKLANHHFAVERLVLIGRASMDSSEYEDILTGDQIYAQLKDDA